MSIIGMENGGLAWRTAVSALKYRLAGLGPAVRRALRDVEAGRPCQQAEDARRTSEAHYRSLFENLLEGIAVCRMHFEQGRPLDFTFLDVNGAFATLTGLKNVVGKSATEVIPGLRESNPELFETCGRVAQTGQPERFELYVKSLSVWFDIRVHCPEKNHFAAVFDVITKRKQDEFRISHLNDVLRAVREVNQLILREANPQRLLEEACNILVQTRGCCLVWIGQLEPGSKRVVPTAIAGDMGMEYLRGATITWDESATGRGPIGTALRQRVTCVCPNTATDPCFAPWREPAMAKGFASVAAVPIIQGSRLFGVVAFYADCPEAFDAEELALLSELAGDLAFALLGIENARERARAEAALRDSELRFLQVTQHVGEWVWEVDVAGLYTYSSPAGEKLHGYPGDEVVGKLHYYDLFPLDRAEQLKAAMLKHFKRRMPFGSQKSLCVHKDGHIVIRETSGTPIRDSQGHWVGYRGADVDITERERAEARNREQAALLDHARDAIIVADLVGWILYWNRGAERIYGWTLEEILEQGLPPKFDEPCVPPQREIQRMVVERGEWSGELRQKNKSGAEIVVQSRRSLVRDEWGQPKSILIINTDITEEKKLQAQFLRAQRLESIGQLAGGIAHDLNNILSPILMGIPLVQSKVGDPAERAMLEGILASAKRGADIVKQVLTFARGTDGQRVPVQSRYLVQEMAQIMRETFPKSIVTRAKVAKDLWPVLGNATQLHQVLMNLCVNARDALPQGGMLTLTARNTTLDEVEAARHPLARAGDYVTLSVADDGTGIAPEILSRIFDPFYTTKGDQGTGLGLSTVMGIVNSHGGFIQVESQMGRGSQFHVYLPAIKSALAAEDTTTVPTKHQGRGELILCVDDEEEIRRVLSLTLKENGYRVLTANDGAQAVALFQQNRSEIQAIVIDLFMPVKGGARAIEEICQLNPLAIIIVMTGQATREISRNTQALGVAGFVEKPMGIRDIVPLLYQLLHGPITALAASPSTPRIDSERNPVLLSNANA